MAMGQVAGCAAAIAAKKAISVKDVPHIELCNQLKSIGAIVPQSDKL